MRKGLGLSLIAIIAAALALSGSAGASSLCDLVASPNGSDTASGTPAAPFRTTQKLVDSLASGQTGCLRGGTYYEDVRIGNGGSPGAPVTLTSYPGEIATLTGRLWIAQGANYVTLTRMRLDGANAEQLPSPTVDGNAITFSDDDVTNDHTSICFDLGSDAYGIANGTLITRDRIHDCGKLPADNHEHGIYVDVANNTRIEWNLIYDNADRGIQLYPDAQNTTIDHNVIDGNGEGLLFSGDGGFASSNANVYANLITNSRIRHDAESWYPQGNPVGTENLLRGNCIWGGREGTIDTSGGGFAPRGNVIANPLYVDPARHDYRLRSTSPCLGLTGDIAAEVDGPTATAASTHSSHRRPRGRSAVASRNGSRNAHRARRPRRRHGSR